MPSDLEIISLGDLGDALDLTAAPYEIEEIKDPVAKPRPNWVDSPDTDGALLDAEPRYENVEMMLRVRVWVDDETNMDAALAAVGALNDKLAQCAARPGGLPFRRTPARSTRTYTGYAQLGEIDDLPVDAGGELAGWLLAKPVIVIKLTRAPFYEGDQITLAEAQSNARIIGIEVPNVPGDAPAKARLVLTDTSSRPRRYIEIGVEASGYDPGNPAPLIIDSDALSVGGYGGVQVTETGARDANASGTNAIKATVSTQPTAICATTPQPHIGVFRVRARVKATSVNVRFRLEWQVAAGQLTANRYVRPPTADAFCDVNLGLITIPRVTRGTQRWTGRIIGLGIDDRNVWIDELSLIPAGGGYARLHLPFSEQPGVVVARDSFTGIADAANLGDRAAAPAGGGWSSSGSAGQFTGRPDAGSIGDAVRRATASDTAPRFAVLGDALTDMRAGARFRLPPLGADTNGPRMGVLARFVDINNYLVAWLKLTNDLAIDQVIGGSSNRLATLPAGSLAYTPEGIYSISLSAFATGRVAAVLRDQSGKTLAQLEAQSTALATGGTLAIGKGGLYDYNPTAAAVDRYYDDFVLAVPPAEPVVLNPDRRLEHSYADSQREDPTGQAWATISPRGSRLWLAPAGDRGLVNRVAVKPHVNDIDVTADDDSGTALLYQLAYTPRFLTPR